MAIVRYQPSRGADLNRLFGTLFDSPTTAAHRGAAARRWVPAVDLVEADDRYVLKADLPGLTAEDVTIEVTDDVLTVSGERHGETSEKRDGYVRLERHSGAFRRSVRLPEGVDAERVAASFEHGVLEVSIPKPEARKPHRVEIAVAAAKGDDADETPAAA
jgi:HSP20 family protein